MTGTELAMIRKRLGLTQQTLSERLLVTPGHIARLEMRSNQGRWPVSKSMERELNRMITEHSRPQPEEAQP